MTRFIEGMVLILLLTMTGCSEGSSVVEVEEPTGPTALITSMQERWWLGRTQAPTVVRNTGDLPGSYMLRFWVRDSTGTERLARETRAMDLPVGSPAKANFLVDGEGLVTITVVYAYARRGELPWVLTDSILEGSIEKVGQRN